MKFEILEENFFYVPEDDPRYNDENDGVIRGKTITKIVNSLIEALEEAIKFTANWPCVKPDETTKGNCLELYFTSNMDTEYDKKNPDHYYTKRHSLIINLIEK